MNEGESPDNLLGLQQEIRGLRRELELLSSRVVSLEADARAAPQSTIGPAPSPTVGHAAPPPLPKKAPWHQETADERLDRLLRRKKLYQPEAPVETVVAPEGAISPSLNLAGDETTAGDRQSSKTGDATEPVESIDMAPAATRDESQEIDTEPESKPSFELKLGAYWFVRVGIVMLLTGIVFLANLAYKKWVVDMGPAGKVFGLYLVSGILLGAGVWIRKRHETLRNYGQVLFAGGLAAVYFTTYAAHAFEPLRVIPNQLLAGFLLVGWSGFIAWLADRGKSEIMALFGIGLAYYAAIINKTGYFTLFSSAALTVAAIYFLIRNRWAILSYVSLAGTYGGWAFWRFYHHGETIWRGGSLESDTYWVGLGFLLCYWSLFTVAVFISRAGEFDAKVRATFLTANNALMVGFGAFTTNLAYPDSFWLFPTITGGALLALMWLARTRLSDEPNVENGYLVQGLLLITWGVMTCFTGSKLALSLGIESVILVMLGYSRQSQIMKAGAFITTALAVALSLDDIGKFDGGGAILGMSLMALFVFNAWWLQNREDNHELEVEESEKGYFAGAGVLLCLYTTWRNLEWDALTPALTLEAAAIVFSVYFLRVQILGVFGLGYLLLAQALCVGNLVFKDGTLALWSPVAAVAVSLGILHWLKEQATLKLGKDVKKFFLGAISLGVVGVAYFGLRPHFSAEAWLGMTAFLALLFAGYGGLTRAPLLAACGQLFLAASLFQFVFQLFQGHPAWWLALAPILVFSAYSIVGSEWLLKRAETRPPDTDQLIPVLYFCRAVVVALSMCYVLEYFPVALRFGSLAVIGCVVSLWGASSRVKGRAEVGSGFVAVGYLFFWFHYLGGREVHWLDAATIVLLLCRQLLIRRLPELFNLDRIQHTVIIFAGGGSLWLWLTRWAMEVQGGFLLTVVWGILAFVLVTVGFSLKESEYRRLGILVLALSFARIFLFDIWTLSLGFRVLSFMALGLVLIALGYIYNRHQSKIREWL